MVNYLKEYRKQKEISRLFIRAKVFELPSQIIKIKFQIPAKEKERGRFFKEFFPRKLQLSVQSFLGFLGFFRQSNFFRRIQLLLQLAWMDFLNIFWPLKLKLLEDFCRVDPYQL